MAELHDTQQREWATDYSYNCVHGIDFGDKKIRTSVADRHRNKNCSACRDTAGESFKDCWNCHYWNKRSNVYGDCIRYAPRGEEKQPMTHHAFWCGEWKTIDAEE